MTQQIPVLRLAMRARQVVDTQAASVNSPTCGKHSATVASCICRLYDEDEWREVCKKHEKRKERKAAKRNAVRTRIVLQPGCR